MQKIQQIPIPPYAKLVSFDVKNLFPSTPTSDCKLLLRNLLDKSACPIPVRDEFQNLFNLCMDQNYFTFDNKFYRQTSGLPMGSPLSPLLADIFMDSLEQTIFLSNHPLLRNITYWHRYVDDILVLWTGTTRQIDLFTDYLNNLHPNIQFTTELQNEDKSINFLDLNISISGNKHTFNIFRKSTHTDTVIHNSSQHPIQHKHAAFHYMIHRLLSLPLTQSHFLEELNTIQHIARSNGYDTELINNILRRKTHKQKLKMYTSLSAVAQTPDKYTCLPYFGNLSEKVAHNIRKAGIKVSFKSQNSLRKMLSSKTHTDLLEKSGVYSLHCHDCEAKYIGQTGRTFNTRIKEHIHAWKHNSCKSHFANHLLQTGHTFDPHTDIHILEIENHYHTRLTLENLHIHLNDNLLNENINHNPSPLLKLLLDTTLTPHSSGAAQ